MHVKMEWNPIKKHLFPWKTKKIFYKVLQTEISVSEYQLYQQKGLAL